MEKETKIINEKIKEKEDKRDFCTEKINTQSKKEQMLTGLLNRKNYECFHYDLEAKLKESLINGLNTDNNTNIKLSAILYDSQTNKKISMQKADYSQIIRFNLLKPLELVVLSDGKELRTGIDYDFLSTNCLTLTNTDINYNNVYNCYLDTSRFKYMSKSFYFIDYNLNILLDSYKVSFDQLFLNILYSVSCLYSRTDGIKIYFKQCDDILYSDNDLEIMNKFSKDIRKLINYAESYILKTSDVLTVWSEYKDTTLNSFDYILSIKRKGSIDII